MNEWTLSQQKDIAPSATGGHPNYIIRFPPYWYKNQPAIIGQSSSTVSRWADPLQAVKWTNMLNQKNNWNGPENICRNDWGRDNLR